MGWTRGIRGRAILAWGGLRVGIGREREWRHFGGVESFFALEEFVPRLDRLIVLAPEKGLVLLPPFAE